MMDILLPYTRDNGKDVVSMTPIRQDNISSKMGSHHPIVSSCECPAARNGCSHPVAHGVECVFRPVGMVSQSDTSAEKVAEKVSNCDLKPARLNTCTR